MNCVLPNVLLLELKFTMRSNSAIDEEVPINVFSSTRNLFALDLKRTKLHLMLGTVLDVVTNPFTFFEEVEIAIHSLDIPLTGDGLSFLFTLVVDLMRTLILLNELNIFVLSIETHEFEFANLVLAFTLNFVAFNLELLESHFVFITVLLVPALPDAHLIYRNKFIFYIKI